MRAIEPRCSRADRMKLYEEYYLKQTGNGMPAFTGAQYQRGHGLGNMLRSLTKFALPMLKKGVRSVGKQVLKTGMNIAQDAMHGQNIKSAAKRHLSQGITELVTQHGRGKRMGPPGERIKRKKQKKSVKRSKKGYKRKAVSSHRFISSSAKRQRTSKKDALG